MQIIERKISELKPYANNPRLNDGAVDAVAASIKNFGFKVPIILDRDGEIIAGHTRLKAAQKLKMKTVPVIIADDLTPEQVKAFRKQRGMQTGALLQCTLGHGGGPGDGAARTPWQRKRSASRRFVAKPSPMQRCLS